MMYFVIDGKISRVFLPAFLILLFGIPFISCDPRGTDEMYRGGAFQIKAKVLNPQDSLYLGDSLKVVFEIPDTILLKGFPYDINITGEQILLTEKSYCELGEEVRIADSNVTGGINLPLAYNWCKLYANPGTISGNNVLRLTKIGSKLMATYYLIPTRKGIFYIASGGLGGYFDGNSTSGKIKCRIVFDFDVSDKHHNLLRSAVGQNNNIEPMLQQMSSRGQGLYAFAVK